MFEETSMFIVSSTVQRIRRSAAAMAALAALAFLPRPSAAGESVTIDGELHIRNGRAPAKGVETVSLEEIWRAGGENDEEVFFGLISQVLTDEKGNVYLLDTQLSEIQVYSPDGVRIKTLSREGDGPGETKNPSDMLFMADGSIGLVQTFPGKIVQVDREGAPAGVFTVGDATEGGFVVLIDALQAEGGVVCSGILISANPAQGTQTRTSILASYNPDGSEKTRYLEKVDNWDFNKLSIIEKNQYFVFPRRWTVAADGRVFSAPERNGYAIHVHKADGTLDRIIERQYEPWRRTEKDLAVVNAIMEGQKQRIPFEVETKVEDTEPDISEIRAAPDGSIWVLSSRGNRDQPEGILMTYDVFDAEGHFTKQVQIECEGDSLEDGLIFAGNDRVIRITGFMDALISLQGGSSEASEEEEEEEGEAAPMEAICYSMKAGS